MTANACSKRDDRPTRKGMSWQSKAEPKDKRAGERVSVVVRGTNRCLRIITASYDDLIQTHAMPRNRMKEWI